MPKTPIKDIISKHKLKKTPTSVLDMAEFITKTADAIIVQRFNEAEEDIRSEISEAIDKIAETMHKGDKGDKGESIIGLSGPKGDKPIAGIDYPIPKDGKDGENGQDSLIPGPKGDKGDSGKDGSSDTPEQIANKLNTLEEKIDQKTIKGLNVFLRNLQNSIRESIKQKSGGGMGDWIHQQFSLTASTTYVDLTYNIAAKGYAVLAFYQGQEVFRGTHYTQSAKRLTLTFTPEDNTKLDVIYVRT